MRSVRLWAGMITAATLLAACGGSGGTSNNPATTIAKSSAPDGDGQTDSAAAVLTDSIRVVVQENATAKAGATVNWSVVGAGGGVSPSSSVTDANGLAASQWTLGTAAGAATARATLAGAGGSPVSFTATVTPGHAASITKVAGDNQTQLVSGAFATALQAKVTDQFNNPIPNATVNWTASGAVTASLPSSTTNAQGIASVNATAAATSGSGTITASVAGVVATPAFSFAVADREAIAGDPTNFRSARNNTQNPAVDTIPVNGTMLWVHSSGTHSVLSTGSPSFTSESGTLGSYAVTFTVAGTYTYECGIHGPLMTGRIVVQ